MAQGRTPGTNTVFEFDDFRLETETRQLFRGGEPVPLQGKAFEMLCVLVENRGRLLTKDELFSLVWPDQIVEESNLTVNISAIRKALGERGINPRLITTVSGRGYRFLGQVREAACKELTVESETFRRVVIEREEFETTDAEDEFALRLAGESRASSKALAPALPALAEKVGPRRFLRTALIATLIGGLVLACGIWFYRTRQRDGRVAATSALVTHRFDTHGGLPIRVTISPDGKSLAYIQRLKDRDTLWLGQVETNGSAPVYQQPDLLLEPVTFSPDGGNLYFRVRGDRPRPMLVRMPALGGPLTELLPDVYGRPSFSPDGQRIAFLRRNEQARETSIILADAVDGRGEHSLATRRWPEDFSGEGPAWSPDGRSIAAAAHRSDGREEILTFDAALGVATKIGDRDWGGVENLVWLPDGRALLVVAKEGVGELRVRQIWQVAYPEGEARQRTDDLNHFVQPDLSISAAGRVAFSQGRINSSIWVAPGGDPKQARLVLQGVMPRYEGVDGLAWTPSGRLFYSAYVGDSLVIWSSDTDGGDLRQLTPAQPHASDNNLSASANGSLVVFQSNRSGGMEIWRVGSDGSGLRQLTQGGDNTLPTFSPDSRWVIYVSERGGRRTLWRVNVEGGETQQLTDYTALVPQVSPDGRYIAAFVSAPTSPDYKLAIIPFEGGAPQKTFDIPKTVFRGRARMVWEPGGKAIIYKDDPQGLWRQALDEIAPRPIEGFEEMHMRQFAWSFDGRSLAYASGPATQEIILVENFR